MDKTFNVKGREYRVWELTNNDLMSLVKSETISDDDKKILTEQILERFKWDCCPRTNEGETNDELFARNFSEFVNGKCNSKKKVAKRMAMEHRYLQNEMFKVCMEYIKILAENAQNGRYDPRNEWACKTSQLIVENLEDIKYYF